MRILVQAWLCLGALGAVTVAALAESPASSNLIIVSEDLDVEVQGCDAVSVFSSSAPDPLYHGEHHTSPGRLATDRELTTVLASPSNADNFEPFLYLLGRREPDSEVWSTRGTVTGANFTFLGGIAIAPDGDEFLVALSGQRPTQEDSFGPPFLVGKFRLSELESLGYGRWRIGPLHGSIEVASPAAEILCTAVGKHAHVVTESATVVTLETGSMRPAASDIQMQPVGSRLERGHGDYMGVIHATVTSDGRYLISNRWDAPGINVADLAQRESWILPVNHDVALTGGVSINHASQNQGLLALHAVDEVLVFAFEPLGPLELLSRRPASRPSHIFPKYQGRVPSIEWSGKGEYLVAASVRGLGERTQFDLLSVSEGGNTITLKWGLSDCREGMYPNDVLTTNAITYPPSVPTLPPPNTPLSTPSSTSTLTSSVTVTPTAPSTSSATSTPLPSVSVTSSAVPTLTPAASPSRAPTRVPGHPLYLPIVLAEFCPPPDVFTDVVLVLDASTSMLETTADTRRKIDAAEDAARIFLDGLRLLPGQDRAAIVTFNDAAQTLQGLTHDSSFIQYALTRIRISQYTRVDLGIERATVELVARGRQGHVQAMVVLSDGMANPVSADTVIEATQRARLAGITVYVVGMGPSMDERVLRAMASGPARFFPAPDPTMIRSIYADLTKRVPCPVECYWGKR